MSLLQRAARHARLSLTAARPGRRRTPPFFILYVNSKCNLTCEHCFYWRSLNQSDDLTFEEYHALSSDLGEIENLNLCGGEPFLRDELADICTLFIQNNHAKRVYVPTNGYFTDRTRDAVSRVLRNNGVTALVCELSLDGMPEYHNRLRGNPKSFERAMETYDMLAELHRNDPRLGVHATSTATHNNLDELSRLTEFLHERCPEMEHHNLAIIRGDRKNTSLTGPDLEKYQQLYQRVKAVWRDREKGRFGSVVEPLLQQAKCKTIQLETQYVPCTAGNLTGVVYANGDVSLCETHPPLGNLRERPFFEIWDSAEADALRRRIRARHCHCTNEVFLWPSVVFQPASLVKTFADASMARPGRLQKTGSQRT